WAELAAVHHDRGGATAELPGVRLSSSGLPHPQWNNGDVHEPSAVDLPAVRAWFTRRGVPWGLRLPAGADWSVGRRLFAKRLMALAPERFAPAAAVDGLVVRRAGPADLETV